MTTRLLQGDWAIPGMAADREWFWRSIMAEVEAEEFDRSLHEPDVWIPRDQGPSNSNTRELRRRFLAGEKLHPTVAEMSMSILHVAGD